AAQALPQHLDLLARPHDRRAPRPRAAGALREGRTGTGGGAHGNQVGAHVAQRDEGSVLDVPPHLAAEPAGVQLGDPGAGGSDDEAAAATPSKAATHCREQWKKLGKDIASDAAQTTPSALPERWNTVAATIDYYSTSATGKGCSDQIDEQEKAIAALKAWS